MFRNSPDDSSPIRLPGERRRCPLFRKAFYPLIIAGTGATLLLAPDAAVLAQASRGYPMVALAAVAFIAWRLRRSRIIMAALSLILAHAAVQSSAFGSDVLAFALIATFVPPGLALLSLTRDRPLFAPGTLTQAAAVFGPVLVAGFIAFSQPPEVLSILTQPMDPETTEAWFGLPDAAIITGAATLGILAFIALRSRRPVESALAWMTLAMLLALAAPADSVARGVWVLAGALVLAVGLVEASYVLAFHDELTGLPGRRALSEAISALRPPYSIAIIDIDHFKQFNDKHGHDVGDQVLCMVASKLAEVGGGGTAYRSGGEEFTIVFPGLEKAEARPHLEAVREAVASSTFTVRRKPRPSKKKGIARRGKSTPRQQQLAVTISVGVASPGRSSKEVADVVKAADKAMYRAKESGRNQVA